MLAEGALTVGSPLGERMARNFKDLSEREIQALAITLEEEDSRIYADFADGLRETYPATAKMLEEMQGEESDHRRQLIDDYRGTLGNISLSYGATT